MEKHAFHSRGRANEGRKLFLELPDGTVTEAYAIILGKDSDAMVRARREYQRKLIANNEEKVPNKDLADDLQPWLLAHGVKVWNFDGTEVEPTIEEVQEFLVEAPHMFEKIDQLIYNRSAFFAKG